MNRDENLSVINNTFGDKDNFVFIGTSESTVSSWSNAPSADNSVTDDHQVSDILQPGWRRDTLTRDFADSKICFSGLINLGNEHFRRGEYTEALHSYKEAARMANTVECLRDDDMNCLAMIAFHNMGVIYCISKDFKAGFKHFLKSLFLQGNHTDISECIQIKSTVKQLVKGHIENDDLKSAQDLLFDAVEVLRFSTHMKETTALFEYVLLAAVDLIHREDNF